MKQYLETKFYKYLNDAIVCLDVDEGVSNNVRMKQAKAECIAQIFSDVYNDTYYLTQINSHPITQIIREADEQ